MQAYILNLDSNSHSLMTSDGTFNPGMTIGMFKGNNNPEVMRLMNLQR